MSDVRNSWPAVIAVFLCAMALKAILRSIGVALRWQDATTLTVFVFASLLVATRVFWCSARYWVVTGFLMCLHFLVILGVLVFALPSVTEIRGYYFVVLLFAETFVLITIVERMARWFRHDPVRRRVA